MMGEEGQKLVLSIYLVSRDPIHESVLQSKGFYRLNHLSGHRMFLNQFSPSDVSMRTNRGEEKQEAAGQRKTIPSQAFRLAPLGQTSFEMAYSAT